MEEECSIVDYIAIAFLLDNITIRMEGFIHDSLGTKKNNNDTNECQPELQRNTDEVPEKRAPDIRHHW